MSARKTDTFFEKYYHIVYPQCRYDRDGRPFRSDEVIGPRPAAHARPAQFRISSAICPRSSVATSLPSDNFPNEHRPANSILADRNVPLNQPGNAIQGILYKEYPIRVFFVHHRVTGTRGSHEGKNMIILLSSISFRFRVTSWWIKLSIPT